MKKSWKPGTMLYPLPAVLVSCGSGTSSATSGVLTVAWTGIVCTNPPMLSISVRPERASYPLIKERGEFTVNLTTGAMARATDFCGVRSRRDVADKWEAAGIHPSEGVAVGCPYVEESPVSLECRVVSETPLGSHNMFVAEIVNVLVDERLLDPETGKFQLEKAGLMNYSHGQYFLQGRPLGTFGFSVKRPLGRKARQTKQHKK